MVAGCRSKRSLLEGLQMTNWKTTSAGIAAILVVIAHVLVNLSNGDASISQADIMGIITGIGLILGKDFNVTGGKQ